MPFDGIADPVAAKSLQALDLMEDRLQGGRKWTRHFMFRDGGKMCLLGASPSNSQHSSDSAIALV